MCDHDFENLLQAVVREQKREIALLKEKKEMKEQESEATLVEMKIFVARESDLSPVSKCYN
jgi:hypothetical protein